MQTGGYSDRAMSETDQHRADLRARIRELEAENERLRAGLFSPTGEDTVRVPERFRGVFDEAQHTVREYFRTIQADPSQGTIEIAGERYVLVRASALSYGFLRAIRKLYADRGDAEALHIGKTLLFDMAHVIGINDARKFHRKVGVTDPVAKLSSGPVHFAYSGWAFVEILPESSPTPDDDYVILYNHPFSFESDSWIRAGHQTDFPVCVMGAGYSSGWCEESFGLELTATEITCKAKGDEHCTFVMAPPHRIREHVERVLAAKPEEHRRKVVTDIPLLFERKAVEERLRDAVARAEQANEAKSLFLANMSHEIRTPLTGVLGIASLLARRDLSDEDLQLVKTIERSGQALLQILNDILDLSKVEAGMMSVSPGPCDVRAVLGEVADVLGARIAEKGLSLEVEVDESVPRLVEADALRVRQIVLNLAGNAVKFTESGSIVLRAACTPPGTLHVEVEDTGIGIEESDAARLFEVFVQGDTSDTRRYQGTGLGLSIARHLLRLMGGTINMRSRVGNGSTFFFDIPAEPLEGAIERDRHSGVPLFRFDARILLVEDDPVSRHVIQKLLAQHGCRIDPVSNGREAVAAWRGGRYDAVFMDCQMPVMDGYEATAHIRGEEAGVTRTPIIAMTAGVMPGQSERYLDAGMDDFLGKPLDPERLQAILARWIGGRRVN